MAYVLLNETEAVADSILSIAMSLRILLLDERDRPLSDAGELLAGAGYAIISSAPLGPNLPQQVQKLQPDLMVIQTTSPTTPLLDALQKIQQVFACPVVMYTRDDDVGAIRKAVEAGVSAYVVDEIHAERLRPIIEAARARFEYHRSLENEVQRLRTQLTDRKRIEQAKGLIMEHKGLSEAGAYQLLRKTAMERNKRLIEIADSIIDAHTLLGAGV